MLIQLFPQLMNTYLRIIYAYLYWNTKKNVSNKKKLKFFYTKFTRFVYINVQFFAQFIYDFYTIYASFFRTGGFKSFSNTALGTVLFNNFQQINQIKAKKKKNWSKVSKLKKFRILGKNCKHFLYETGLVWVFKSTRPFLGKEQLFGTDDFASW